MALYRLMHGKAVHDAPDDLGNICDKQFLPGDVIESDDDLLKHNTPGMEPRYVLVADEDKFAPMNERRLTEAELKELQEKEEEGHPATTKMDPVFHASPPATAHSAPPSIKPEKKLKKG